MQKDDTAIIREDNEENKEQNEVRRKYLKGK